MPVLTWPEICIKSKIVLNFLQNFRRTKKSGVIPRKITDNFHENSLVNLNYLKARAVSSEIIYCWVPCMKFISFYAL